MREIEIKFRVSDLSSVEERLKEKGCVIDAPLSQHDITYALGNSEKELEAARAGDVVIRIRKIPHESQINLKEQKTDGMMDSLEYETTVADPEVMDQILKKLGWNPVIEVKKERKKGKWGAYEVCLDQVDRLGSFVEIEKLCEDEVDLDSVREEIFKEAETLGIKREDIETRHYDTQMYQLTK